MIQKTETIIVVDSLWKHDLLTNFPYYVVPVTHWGGNEMMKQYGSCGRDIDAPTIINPSLRWAWYGNAFLFGTYEDAFDFLMRSSNAV